MNDPESHTRYARIDVKNQRVYEHPDISNVDMVINRNCLALAGNYVVKSKPLIDFVSKHDGIPIYLESINHLYSGYVKHLKMSMVLRGFPGLPENEGLNFDVYTLERGGKNFNTLKNEYEEGKNLRLYTQGIKSRKDIKKYSEDPVAKFLSHLREIQESFDQTKIFDPYIDNIQSAIYDNNNILAFCGIYLVNTKKYSSIMDQLPYILASACWSFNGLHNGYSCLLRLPMCLQGSKFLGNKGLPFIVRKIVPDKCIHGIKNNDDIEKYRNNLKKGYYIYRNCLPSIPSQKFCSPFWQSIFCINILL